MRTDRDDDLRIALSDAGERLAGVPEAAYREHAMVSFEGLKAKPGC